MEPTSYELTVDAVVEETPDARSLVFAIPEELAAEFKHQPGQFLTLAVPSDRTGSVARCYSLSNLPGEAPTVTVKRTADGYASNWICDNVAAGATIRVLPPSGVFTPKSLDGDFVLLAGGSGITPVMSILRTVLRDGSGRVTLLYANRDERSVIFAAELARLAEQHADRLRVHHWLESVQGLPSSAQLTAFLADHASAEAFVCGPAAFMDLAVASLKEVGFPRERRHQEKFNSLSNNPFAEDQADAAQAEIAAAEADTVDPLARTQPAKLEVELDGEEYAWDDWQADVTLLEHLESKGIKAPFSCRSGECSACAFRLLEGEVTMKVNDVLDEEDLADGIRLGCQSYPDADCVKATYS